MMVTDMKCPYCDKEMTKGYIQCRDGLFWTPKKQLVASLSVFGKGKVTLENDGGRNCRTVYAYNCLDCNKVIIPYNEPI